MKRADWVGLFNSAIGLLIGVQALTMAIPDEKIQKITSGTVMFLACILAGFSQYLSVEIKKGAMTLPAIILVVAILGGFLDYAKLLPFNDTVGMWIRFGISIGIYVLNEISKKLFPTLAADAISTVRSAFVSADKEDKGVSVATRMIEKPQLSTIKN